jgi:hypothetical protein
MVKQKPAKTDAVAFEVTHDKGGVVGIGNLRVIIVEDEGAWFAQGLEIDYAAQGSSLPNVKKHFEDGLAATVKEHLRIYGTIKNLLKPAPDHVWEELLLSEGAKLKKYSQVTWYEFSEEMQQVLPFQGISYAEPLAA